MTKRFTNVNEDIFQYGEWYCSAKSEHCADVIATALNMVTEENEQLKQEIQSIYEIIEEYVHTHHAHSSMRMKKQIEKVMWNDRKKDNC